MTTIVHMYGALASHRRARVLQEAIAASPAETLPDDGGVVVMFGEDFQQGDVAEQKRIINWTRSPGRVLLLLPPYKLASCSLPVAWRPERIETPPTGGESFDGVLANSRIGWFNLGKSENLRRFLSSAPSGRVICCHVSSALVPDYLGCGAGSKRMDY